MIRQNIVANYVGAGSVSLLPVLALPFYLNALGPKQFGLVSFVAMLQAFFGLLDAGISQALIREIAHRFDGSVCGQKYTAKLLFGFERIYWLFALLAGSVISLMANTISSEWLHLGDTSITVARNTVYAAAVIFVCQFPGAVYRSVLVGVQSQILLNKILLSAALLRHIGGVIVVLTWPTLSSYFIWQALISLVETLVRGRYAWASLGFKRSQIKWDTNDFRLQWGVVAGMAGAVLLGALAVQIDKIILSRMVSIEQFGYYTLASTVAIGFLQLIYPISQAALPRATQLHSEPILLRKFYFKLTWLILLVTFFVAFIFIVSGKFLLGFWLNNQHSVDEIYPLISILLLGSGLNAFYNIGYIDWMVHEKVYRIYLVNIISITLSLSIIPILVLRYGVIGAAFGWLSMNLIGFLLSLGWLKRAVIK